MYEPATPAIPLCALVAAFLLVHPLLAPMGPLEVRTGGDEGLAASPDGPPPGDRFSTDQGAPPGLRAAAPPALASPQALLIAGAPGAEGGPLYRTLFAAPLAEFGPGRVGFLIPAPGTQGATSSIDVKFPGASVVAPRGVGPLDAPIVRSFRGGPGGAVGHTHQPFVAVVYQDLYPGVDLRYETSGRQVKYTWYLDSAAAVATLRMEFSGASSLQVDDSGALVVHGIGGGELRDSAPVSFQGEEPVTCAFELQGSRTVGFRCDAPDPEGPLVIDPLVQYTFLGGQFDDQIHDVEIGPTGDLFLAGLTSSPDFPNPDPTRPLPIQVDGDFFLARADPAGSALAFVTIIAGLRVEQNVDIALLPEGRVVLAGMSNSTNAPATPGTFGRNQSGFNDVFIATLDAASGQLLAGTFLGSTAEDQLGAVVATPEGTVLVVGGSNSVDFPTTPGAFRTNYLGTYDAFVSEFDANLTRLVASTRFGGLDIDGATAVAVAPNGTVLVAGLTHSLNLPTTNESFQPNASGDGDLFVAHLSRDLRSCGYATYFGGTEEEGARAIAVASDGGLVVAGYTESPLFPTTVTAFNRTLNGYRDGFVAKFVPNGTQLEYATLLGGSDNDTLVGMAVDPGDRVWVAGWTDSTDFPTTGGPPVANATGRDVVVAVLPPLASTLIESRRVGGPGYDWAHSLAIDGNGSAWVAGFSSSDNFTTEGDLAPVTARSAGFDAWLGLFQADKRPVALFEIDPPEGTVYTLFSFNGSASYDPEEPAAGVELRWDLDGDGAWDTGFSTDAVILHRFRAPGNFTVRMEARDAFGSLALASRDVRVLNLAPSASLSVAPRYGLVTSPIALNASGSGDAEDPLDRLQFRFDFEGDGAWDTGWGNETAIVHRYGRPGDYSPAVEVRDTWGDTALADGRVTINNTAPVANATATPVEGTVETEFRLDASNSTDLEDGLAGLEFRWDCADGPSPPADWSASATHACRFDATGTYTIAFEVRDSHGLTNNSSLHVVVINTGPKAEFSFAPLTGNITQRFQFNASASRDLETPIASLRFRWDFDSDAVWDTPWKSLPFAEWSFDRPGRYMVALQVEDTDGARANNTVEVVVRNEPPDARLAIRLPGGALCDSPCTARGPLTLDATGSTDLEDASEALRARWDYDGDGRWDTDWSDELTASYRYDETGVWTVFVEVEDTEGFSRVTKASVEVKAVLPEASQGVDVSPWIATILLLAGAGVAVALWARRRWPDPKAPPPPGP